MSFSEQHRAGYPAVTRREAHALGQAREAARAIAARARTSAYSLELENVRAGSVLMERGDVARDAIVALLIAALVHADSRQAEAALDRL